jgi:tetratricopeptide (TPR) repeat protein
MQYGNRAAAMNPNLTQVRETLGRIYQYTGKLDEALAEYRRAIEMNPMAIGALFRMGQIYTLQGKPAQAEENYKQVIARMPTYWLGYSGLGELYFNQGKFAEAAKQFQQMIDRMPGNPLGYEDLGGAYAQMGDYQRAIAAFQKGLAVQATPELWSDLGSAYMFTGQYSKAIEPMEKAVALNPHDHMLWRNLADSYRQVPSLAAKAPDTYRKALETSQQQLKINPKDKYALSFSGLYEAHLGNKQEARNYTAQALQQAPNDSDGLFTAALVYEIIGERKAALTYLGDSLKAGFSIEDVKREPELQALRSDERYSQLLHTSKVVSK